MVGNSIKTVWNSITGTKLEGVEDTYFEVYIYLYSSPCFVCSVFIKVQRSCYCRSPVVSAGGNATLCY